MNPPLAWDTASRVSTSQDSQAGSKIQTPTVTQRQRARAHTGHLSSAVSRVCRREFEGCPGEGEAAQQTEEVLKRDFREEESFLGYTYYEREIIHGFSAGKKGVEY